MDECCDKAKWTFEYKKAPTKGFGVMMKWAIEVQKTSLERRNLIDLLQGLGYQPIDADGIDNAFTSKKLEGCITREEVWSEAKRLRDSFVNDTDPHFTLGAVIDFSSGKPKRFFYEELVEGIGFRTSPGSATFTILPPKGLSDEERAEWEKARAERYYQARLETQMAKLVPAFVEPRAAKVIELLKCKPHTGELIYKIYELMEEHPSKRKEFHKQFDISREVFTRFSDAVHNPVVSGDLARHAYRDPQKSPNPMSIKEAQSFVENLAKRWVASIRSDFSNK